MNRHWAEDTDRVRPFGRGARAVGSRAERTTNLELSHRLTLLDEAEQLRDQARLDSSMFSATERFIDSLHGPVARPVTAKDSTAR